MSTSLKLIAGSLIVTALSFTPAHAQKFQDSLDNTAGATFGNIEITETTFEKVTFKIRAPGSGKIVSQAQPSYLIKELTYGDMPIIYRQGIGRIKTGEYDEAIRRIKVGMEQDGTRDWIKPHGKFHLGLAHQTKGSYEEAVREYEQLIKDHPDTYFLPMAYEAIAECHTKIGGKNLDAALVAYKTLPKFGEVWTMRAREGEAQVLEAKKDLPGASNAYGSIVQSVRLMKQSDQKKFVEVLGRSYKGLGRTLIAQDRGDEAVAKYKELISYCEIAKFNGGMTVAYNGLGDYLQKKSAFEDAAMEYLRASILYGQGNETEDARALFGAATCFDQLSKQAIAKDDNEAAGRKKEWRNRALQLYKEVKNKYPGTDEGKRAIDLAPPD